MLIELDDMSTLSSQQHLCAVLSVEGQQGSHHHPRGLCKSLVPTDESVSSEVCDASDCDAWSGMISSDVFVVIKISGWQKEHTRGLEESHLL